MLSVNVQIGHDQALPPRERERGREGELRGKRKGGRAKTEDLIMPQSHERGSRTLCKTTLNQIIMSSEINDNMITITQVWRRSNS